MDDLIKIVSIVYLIFLVIIVALVIHTVQTITYSKYCNFHKMEYNSNLDACIDRKNGMIMEIDWSK